MTPSCLLNGLHITNGLGLMLDEDGLLFAGFSG